MVLLLYTFLKCLSQLISKPRQKNHSGDLKALTQVVIPSWRPTRFVFGALLLLPKRTVYLEKGLKPTAMRQFHGCSCLRTQKLIAKCQLCAKITHHEGKFPKESSFDRVSGRSDLTLKWDRLIRHEARRRSGCAPRNAQALYEEGHTERSPIWAKLVYRCGN